MVEWYAWDLSDLADLLSPKGLLVKKLRKPMMPSRPKRPWVAVGQCLMKKRKEKKRKRVSREDGKTMYRQTKGSNDERNGVCVAVCVPVAGNK
jgi:hypothetical protein